MKILIAYDGSQCSESALDDLEFAGLPLKGDALILTVAEVWLPPPSQNAPEDGPDKLAAEAQGKHREKGKRLLAEAETLARHAQARVRASLRDWNVEARATFGSPSRELLSAAVEFCPDVIIAGANGLSALSRLVAGSVSNKVLTEADCSVRIARGRIDADSSALRLIIGFDGSGGAFAAVKAVANRCWPANTEVSLVAATDSIVPTTIGRFISPTVDWAKDELTVEYAWIANLAKVAQRTLEEAGLTVQTKIVEGNPNHVLISDAESWHADCIFVGANAFGGRFERFLLGSTSAAVAARANCSVEVVRRAVTDLDVTNS